MQQDLLGRVVLITGANTGIGYITARELARRGATIFIACRSATLGAAAVERLQSEVPGAKPELLSLDLSDFASIRACAETFVATGSPLHVLINNAGVGGSHGVTASGFELAFGVNHIGHALLTRLLLPQLKRSAPSRIVTVSSIVHKGATGIDFDAVRMRTKTLTGVYEYGVSKLANILFSRVLSRSLEGTGVTTYALHPGVVKTEIWRDVPLALQPGLMLLKLGMITPEQGALTTLHCAASPEAAAESGLYYVRSKPAKPSRHGRNEALAQELWARTEAWISS